MNRFLVVTVWQQNDPVLAYSSLLSMIVWGCISLGNCWAAVQKVGGVAFWSCSRGLLCISRLCIQFRICFKQFEQINAVSRNWFAQCECMCRPAIARAKCLFDMMIGPHLVKFYRRFRFGFNNAHIFFLLLSSFLSTYFNWRKSSNLYTCSFLSNSLYNIFSKLLCYD